MPKGATASPSQIADAQTASNIQTAQAQTAMNAPLGNISNAYGSNQVLTDANGMPLGQVQTMSDPLQSLLGQREGLGSQIGGLSSQLAGSLPTGLNIDYGNTVQDAAQAAYGAQTGFLQPQFDLQSKQLDQQLADRGIPIGSEIYNDAKNQLQNSQNLAYTQAANNAFGAGLQAQAQGFGQGVTQANLPYSWLTSLTSVNPTAALLGMAPGAANLSPTGIQPTNVNQAYQTSIQAQQAQNAQLGSGALGLGQLALSSGGQSLLGGLFGSGAAAGSAGAGAGASIGGSAGAAAGGSSIADFLPFLALL